MQIILSENKIGGTYFRIECSDLNFRMFQTG